MTKEIPLSLQVFHSRNEYQAQRLNRTEQIRLRDLHDVLKREEKLYVKDHALHKQKFHSHYLRRRSEPGGLGSGCPPLGRTNSSASLVNRGSLFSAPGQLQTNRSSSVDTALASRMCTSLGEISTMTRFQRIQRKFSIASFTENGLLTAKGSKMSKDIDQVRNVLFRSKSSVFPKAKQSSFLEKVPDEVEENKDATEENEVLDGEKRNENDRNVDDLNYGLGEVRGNRYLSVCDNRGLKSISEKKIPFTDEIRCKDTPGNESHDNDFVGGRTQFRFGNYKEDLRRQSISQNTNKKRVTIQSTGNDENSKEEGDCVQDSDNPAADKSNTEEVTTESSKDFNEWRSILSRRIKRLDPLQQKINCFLADQTDFNRVFPKGLDDIPKTSTVQKELAEIGREKKEQEKKERAKKKQIVLEVLSKLGIDDETILASYQEF